MPSQRDTKLVVYKSINQTHSKPPITAKTDHFLEPIIEIHEFQDLHFKRGCELSANGTFNWLVDEISELEENLKGNDLHPQKIFINRPYA